MRRLLVIYFLKTVAKAFLCFALLHLAWIVPMYFNERFTHNWPWFPAAFASVFVVRPIHAWSAWPLFRIPGNPASVWSLVGLAVLICAAAFVISAHFLDLSAYPFPDVSIGNNYPVLGVSVEIPLIAAVVEEVSFRGVLQGGLERVLGARWAIAVTTMCFVLGHAGTEYFTREIPLYIAVSALCGILASRTRSLLPAIVPHFTVNALGIAATWSRPFDVSHWPMSALALTGLLSACSVFLFLRHIKAMQIPPAGVNTSYRMAR